MNNSLFIGKLVERWIMSMLIFVLALMLFVVPEGLVEANTDTAFNADDHGGKFVELGGRKWIVVDVVDGKPYLLMDPFIPKSHGTAKAIVRMQAGSSNTWRMNSKI